MIYLEMNHVRKSFGDLEVLKDISLKVEEGEVLSIIGPSGSGKSTLLRCAAMLEMMDGGDLTYLGEQAVTMQNGKSVYAKPAVLRKIQENFGMVFQSFHLFPHYDVMKNLCDAPIHVQKRNRAEVEKSCCRKWDSQEKKRRIRVSFPAVSVRGLRLRVR
jgi:polar amino acid transport system ATP-binding protein